MATTDDTKQAHVQNLINTLDQAGLHPFELGDGIINVHSSAPTLDEDDETYLYTLTLTITP